MKPDERRELRKFGALMTVILAAIGGLVFFNDHHRAAAVLWSVAGLFVALQLSLPVLKVVFRGWMLFAGALGWLNTRIILTVLYYGVITPTGLIMRLLGKRPVDCAFRDGKTTAWQDCPQDGHDYRRMF
ncbi:MAG: hypothetical protein ISR64_02055 [Deltaproteobacteria bacterium]|nr:hypothetical protein [Deltaproteobacteria bacterium]